ncbi:hypothetical protein DW677_08635 [Clostridium sp. AM25-23AC]|nr:hypothetical protein DW677_08635 [Clostridium sp. AM25-23AC]
MERRWVIQRLQNMMNGFKKNAVTLQFWETGWDESKGQILLPTPNTAPLIWRGEKDLTFTFLLHSN